MVLDDVRRWLESARGETCFNVGDDVDGWVSRGDERGRYVSLIQIGPCSVRSVSLLAEHVQTFAYLGLEIVRPLTFSEHV